MTRWLTIPQAAQYGIPERTLRRWCDEGDVQAEKRDGEWHIDLVDLLRRNGLDVLAERLENQEKD